jgi:gliding motility-associated-like protein
MKNTKALLSLIIFFLQLTLFSQTWVQKASLPITHGIQGCFSFSINGKLYVGGGYDNIIGNVVKGFYEYDRATNSWTVKASVPIAVGTNDAFVINGFGYISCGTVVGNLPSNFVYKYDPVNNTWTQMNNFSGSNRQNHICFSLNGHGYMFGGFDGFVTLNEMWEYNVITDSWVQKASPPLPAFGPGRNGPACLVINSKAYVGMGGTATGSNAFTDFYSFNPGSIGVAGSGTYTAMASIPVGREAAAHFTIGDTGYVGIGYNGGIGYLDDFWRYDPTPNTWNQLCNFNGGARQHPFSAVVNGSPYIGCGDFSGGNNSDNWTWDICDLNVHLGNDTAICTGETVTLVDTFSNAHSLWSTGDTTSSITVSGSGTYWLRVIQENCIECTGRDTINITVNQLPTAFDLGHDTSYCGSFSRVLSTGNVNTLWSTGVTAPQITVTDSGTYWARISNSCGIATDTIEISQNPVPQVNLGNDTNLCPGNSLTLDATTASATYLWQNGTGNPTLSVTAAGTYWVDVTVNGCDKRDSIAVDYINPASFNLGVDTTYCGSFSRILTAGAAHTIWSTGDTATFISITRPGIYWAQLTACGDTLIDSIKIIQNPLPIVDLGHDTTICFTKNVILNAGNRGGTYHWQDNSSGQTLTASAQGIYWVDVTVNGCTKRDSIAISTLSPPIAFTIGSDTTICEDSSIVLDANQPNVIYFWNNGDTTSSITVDLSGRYQVLDSNVCGSYTAYINVTSKQCVCKIAIPTAFSPNNDGKNDFFYILTQCPLQNFLFDIYNRWGQKIFQSNAVMDKWDGSYRGVQQPLGVYVYYLHYRDPYTDKDISQTGNVTLLR